MEEPGPRQLQPTVTLFDYGFAGEKICLPNDGRIVNSPERLNDLVSAKLWD